MTYPEGADRNERLRSLRQLLLYVLVRYCIPLCACCGETPPPTRTHTIKSINSFHAIINTSKYARKSASRTLLSGMQLTLHATRPTPHGASRLVQAMSAR